VGDEEKTITVRIAQAFHVVGLVEWEAGLYLAEFIIAHPGTDLPSPKIISDYQLKRQWAQGYFEAKYAWN